MEEYLNAVGFVFNSVKTYIKKDKLCKYINSCCQYCKIKNKQCNLIPPIEPGIIIPCNRCTNNTQYKICIFKLKKKNFVSSSLGISTSVEDAWKEFEENIIYQTNGSFVISVTKCDNTLHSFYANLIRVKKCDCCNSVVLYFKYNIISLLYYGQLVKPTSLPDETVQQNYPYNSIPSNYESNITYDLKSGLYKSVRFFNSQNYSYENYVKNCNPC